MNERKHCLLICGGAFDEAFSKEYIKNQSFDFVVAVDRGLVYADQIGCSVDLILGDFDSVNAEVLDAYKSADNEKKRPRIVKLNPQKDMTDTEEAIDVALSEGATEITILGATGRRLDHLLANINLLMKPLKKSVKACILDKNNRVYLRNTDFSIKRSDLFGKYVSLIPLTSEVSGVTLEGFQYPLNDYTLTIGNSLGVSNEIIQEEAHVSFRDGTLIVIESHD